VPTYEYACGSCGSRYEKREGFDAPARQKCRECGKSTAQRVLFAPPVVFKGSGFYKTDNRGSSGGSDSGSGASETPAPAASADAGHGHSHGPGGHTHGPETSTKSDDKKATTTTETAAAS
jgi:putative FmdB family regulatory protein